MVPRSRLDCLRDSLNAITALVGGRAGGNDISTAEMDQAAAHAPGRPRLVDEAPAGHGWVHEIKYDGYRMHSRIDGGKATLLTRTGLDWSHRYKRTIEALGSLKVKSAYLDGELCAWVANRRSVARAKRKRRPAWGTGGAYAVASLLGEMGSTQGTAALRKSCRAFVTDRWLEAALSRGRLELCG